MRLKHAVQVTVVMLRVVENGGDTSAGGPVSAAGLQLGTGGRPSPLPRKPAFSRAAHVPTGSLGGGTKKKPKRIHLRFLT